MDTAKPEPAYWTHVLPRIPWCRDLHGKNQDIREEVLMFIEKFRPFIPYPKYDNLYDNSWDAFPLSAFQSAHTELSKRSLKISIQPLVDMARRQLPVTDELIAPLEIEGHLRNAFVSRLKPGSVIHPHRGWAPDYLRIHLCLLDDPDCRITVGDQTCAWEEGKLLAFKDGGPYLHSVLHKGRSERIIMSFDLSLSYVRQFIHEMP